MILEGLPLLENHLLGGGVGEVGIAAAHAIARHGGLRALRVCVVHIEGALVRKAWGKSEAKQAARAGDPRLATDVEKWRWRHRTVADDANYAVLLRDKQPV